jgi:hypothetical protein
LGSAIKGVAQVAPVDELLAVKDIACNTRTAVLHTRCGTAFHCLANLRVREDSIVFARHFKAGLAANLAAECVSFHALILGFVVIFNGPARRPRNDEISVWHNMWGAAADFLAGHHPEELTITLALRLEIAA